MGHTQSFEFNPGTPPTEAPAERDFQRRAETEVTSESEGRFEAFVRQMSHGVVIQDPAGQIVFANTAAERILGMTRDQLCGRTSLDPGWRAVREDGSEFPGTEHPSTVALRTGREVRNVVMGIADARDGSRKWISIDAVPRFLPGAATPVDVMVTFDDIAERKRAVEEVIAQREYLRTILLTTADGFWILDTEGRLREINETYSRMLGYSREELLGKYVADFNAVEDAAETTARMKRVMERGSELFETRHRRKDGTVYDVEVSSTYMDMDGGRFVCFGRDISERKRIGSALGESEKLFKDVFNTSPDAILLIDGEAIVDCNQAAVRMLGYEDRETLLRMDAAELSPPLQPDGRDSPEKGCELIATIHANGSHRFEWEHRKANGEILPVEVVATLVVRHGKNLLHVVWRDLTERKRAEAERLKLEGRYRLLFDRANDGIFVMTAEGNLVSVNESFARMHGYTADEMLKMNLRDLDTPESARPIPERMRRIMAGEALTFEVEHYHRDGHVFPLEVSTSLVDSGGETLIQCFHRDITERRRAETDRARLEAQLQQARKLESVGRLAGGVAHDFNNMLGVILGRTEMGMELVDPSQPLHADLEEIRNAARRSADLTRQLLAFARQQIVAPRVVDLNEAVAGMLTMLQRLIGEDIQLRWQPDPAVWPVRVDPSQLDQILANLCVNSRDAIADVGKITVETANDSFDAEYCADHAGFAPGDYVTLSVSDDGCGMDEQTQAHVFEPFFTTKGIGKGTGLGLATVYGAVKQNNGFIHFYSEPGRGTTFKIHLPRHTGAVALARTGEKVQPIPRGTETILLVEDEAAILKLSSRLLEKQGYTVLAAATPGEAIRLALEHHGVIHLLLTDVVMPEMNGRDLASHLLTLHPDIKRLFTSGYTADVIAHHGVLDEGVYFIQKPFSLRDLAIKVRETLQAG
jgi:PAS domain S-box-containing protein